MTNSETGSTSVTRLSPTARSATSPLSAAGPSQTHRAGPRYTDRQDGGCTQEGVLGCIHQGSMATMVPGRVCRYPSSTIPHPGRHTWLYPIIPILGGIPGLYTPLYPPWEAYLGYTHLYTHPGRHTWAIHSLYTPLGGIPGLYTPVTHTVGRHTWAIHHCYTHGREAYPGGIPAYTPP